MARPKTMLDGLRRLTYVMRYFWPALRQERMLMACSLLALLASIIFQLLEPWPLKLVLDRVAPHKHAAGARHMPELFETLSPTQLITVAAISLVLVVWLRAVCDYYNNVGFAIIANRAVSSVRETLYRHIQALPLSFHTQARTGDLLSRVTGDIKLIRDVAITAILPLLGSVLVLTGMVAVMLMVNWQLALLAMLVLPMFAFSTVRQGGRIHQAARQQRQREGALAATASEAISAVHVVQALSLESHFEAGFVNQNTKSVKDGVMSQRASAKLEWTTDVLIAAATSFVLWVGAKSVIDGQMSSGSLIMFLFYLKRGFRPLQDFAKYSARIAKAAAAGERIVELLEITPDIADAPDAQKAPPIAGRLQFDHLRFCYSSGALVFDDLHLTIEPGQFVAVVGTSGAGKSTLLNLVPRMYDPTAGTVRIDGQDIRRWTLASLRSQMSVVLQDTVLFAANVYDNIALGALGVSSEQIEVAARLASAHNFVSALPSGYETMLGERGVNLSHGQRQRIAIARAAVRDAPLLLLDEPTTGLDEENERVVRDALQRLAKGRTTLLVTHDLRDVTTADLIVFIERGRVLEQGTHQQLLSQGGRYATMFRLQNETMSPVLVHEHHVTARH
jgi:ATP-binding cassette, subfamily B, bacterial